MPRPASGIDLKLLEAGVKLVRAKGFYGLTVRETCRLAGVNTGMFHYYFGSKDEFAKAVLKELYAGFMLKFRAGAAVGGTPRERFKNALIEVGKFVRDIKNTAPLLFADMAYGKKETFQFLSGNFTVHLKLIAALAAECRPASAVKGRSVPFIMAAVLPTIMFPAIIAGVLARNGVKTLGDLKLSDIEAEALSDAGIAERAEIAVRGIGL
jgi:AcrR family transcriptional regulator